MEVLRSKVAERPDRDATIEGIYGSKGFFFQQRRGHLDLRGISGIDLEKVVREVDVDTLQLYIENITFCNLREEDLRYLTDPQVVKLFKMSQLIIEYLLYSQDLFVANLGELSKKYVAKKKSLAKKRRELAELEEATKHLRNQVKAKKQNISTLEDLLRENSRRGAHEPKAHPVEQRPVRSDKISFFVAGPDGLCVEFTERLETTIFNLRKSVTQAFVSKKDTESEHYNKVVRLVHKGIILLDDKTIEYYGIKSGDTVVTVIEKGEAVAPSPAVQQPAPVKDNMTEMIEFLSKQQDAMRQFASDIKYGWENALQTIKANRDGEHSLEDSERRLLTKIDDKWNLFESGMKLQLEAKLNDYQALLLAQQQRNKEEVLPNIQVVRRRPHVGELEDDNDMPGLNDITDKLNQFGNQLNRLEVKTIHTDESVDDLRNMLRNRPNATPAPVIINTTTAAAPAPAPAVTHTTKPVAKVEITPPLSPKKTHEMKTIKKEGDTIDPHYNKWNHLDVGIKAAEVLEEKKHVEIKMGSFEVAAAPVKVPEKPAEVPKVKSPPQVKPAEKKVAARKEPAPKPVVEKKPAVKMVDIVFPAVYHTDDMAVFHGEKVLAVQLPETLPPEDVVFILRKEIANKVQVPLTRVILVLRGKSITLDVDADEEALTVESVKSYAANGVLIFKVNKGKPLTNAQLDLLVPAWQRASREDPSPASEADEKKSSTGSSKKLRKRREWDDEDVADDDPQMLSKNMYKVVRGSLDEALSGVSDREGLTDDELHQKMQSLKEFTESLPPTVADHMKSYKGKVTKNIAVASIDSGSEDLLPQVSVSVKGSLLGAGDDVRESQTLRRSRLLSVSRVGHLANSPVPTLLESGAVRRSIEEYNSEEDFVSKYANLKDDSPIMASVTNSVDMRAQFRSASSTGGSGGGGVGGRAESKSMDSPLRGLGGTGSTTHSTGSAAGIAGKKDDAKLVNTTSTTDSLLYSPSHSIISNRPNNRYPSGDRGGNPLDVDSELDDDDDDDHDDREYATVSRVQSRGRGGSSGSTGGHVRASGDFGEGARIDKTMLSSINTLNTIGEHSDGEHYDVMDEVDSEVGDFNDLSQTVDSEGDMLVRNHAVRSSAVRRKADEYERDAAAASEGRGDRGTVPRTPPHHQDSPESKSRHDNRTFSNASKGSNVSLFNNLQSGDMVDDFEDSVHSLAFSHNEDD